MNEKPPSSDLPADARPAPIPDVAGGGAPSETDTSADAGEAARGTPAETPPAPAEAPGDASSSDSDDTPSAGPGEPAGDPSAGDGAAADRPAGESPQANGEPPTLVIRYGRMGLLARFAYTLPRWRRGQRAVIRSNRGIEIGTIVCRWLDAADAHGAGDDLPVRGEVLRLVTHADEVDERHLERDAEREFAFCRQKIAERKLPMKLVDVEHLFGGDRIVFYFVAEKRVDFRALVRDLAREFQTRIEMRQIGVRDEARLLGDYERCGRPLCCRAFMRNLEPVSMKMAKVQKATLDPAKISGRCGRLMCCLRFEHNTYKELARNLPRRNTEVGTPVGKGKVVGTDVVTQIVTVQIESGTRVNVPVESLMAPEDAPTPAEVARAARAERDARDGRQDEPAPPAAVAAGQAARADRSGDAKAGGGGKGNADQGGSGSGRPKRGRRGRRRLRDKNRGRKKGGSGDQNNQRKRSGTGGKGG